MNEWIIVSKSRPKPYTKKDAYVGFVCTIVGVPKGKVYRNYNTALRDCYKLSQHTDTLEIVKLGEN